MTVTQITATMTMMLCLAAAAQAATFTTLYNFNMSGKYSPYYPAGRLQHYGDSLYGVTISDGTCTSAYCGTIFRYLLPRGTVERLHVFAGSPDGGFPGAGLLEVGGLLYGTTLYGGAAGMTRAGTLYQFNPMTKAETVVYSFPSGGGDVFYWPNELIASGTTLYGTMANGVLKGRNTKGALFQYDLMRGRYSVLYEFATVFGNTDGQMPTGSPTLVGKLLFGLTSEGGKASQGTIYKYDTSSGEEAVVHSFTGIAGDGSGPEDHLVAQGGLLYGVSISGGAAGEGTFFSFDPHTRAFHVLYEFGASATDGVMPRNAPVYSNGMFYGTTFKGGAANLGTVYSLNPATGQETVLYSFTGGADGLYPSDLLAVNGVLYGMTSDGGVAGVGSIYKVVP